MDKLKLTDCAFCLLKTGSYQSFEDLLDQGLDVSKKDLDGNTYLHYAVSSHLRLVQKLIQKNVDLHTSNHQGVTPIMKALSRPLISKSEQQNFSDCAYLNPKCVELLLASGAVLDEKCSPLLFDLVQKASHPEAIETLRVVCDQVDDLEVFQDEKGNTLLHAAVQSPIMSAPDGSLSEDGVRLIRAVLGISVHHENKQGQTPLFLALSLENELADDALFLSKRPYPERFGVVEYLLRKGVDVAHKDQNGDTVLHLAAKNGFEKSFNLLVNAGADVYAQNLNGDTPITLARFGVVNAIEERAHLGFSPSEKFHKTLQMYKMLSKAEQVLLRKLIFQMKDAERVCPVSVLNARLPNDVIMHSAEKQNGSN